MKNTLNTDQKDATIFDVARLAGVSTKTVSRVANGEPNVRESTRSHVQKAIDTLDYRANPYARHLSFLRSQAAARSSGQPRGDTSRSG